MEQVRIAYGKSVKLKVKDLRDFQGDLKDLPEENYEKLKKEILDTGFSFAPHVWLNPSNKRWYLVDGHQRAKVLQRLESEGYKIPPIPSIPVQAKSLKEAKRRVLQGTSQYGVMSQSGLKTFIVDAKLNIEDVKVSFEFPQIDLPEFVKEHFRENGESEKEEVEEVPPLPLDPKVKKGDLFTLGEHRLLCGDSMSTEHILRLVNGCQIDLLFTDPPYGINAVNEDGKVGGGTKQAPAKTYKPVLGDEDTSVARKAYEALKSLKIDIPVQIIWGGNYFADFLPPTSCWLVWDKQRPEGLTFSEGELAWTNQDKPLRIIRHRWDGYHRASERDEERVHPTQKPAFLAEYCMDRFCSEEGVNVLDLFGGSGSTLIACQKRPNCRGFIMELDPAYCQVILQRWADLTGEDPIREDGVKLSTLLATPKTICRTVKKV